MATTTINATQHHAGHHVTTTNMSQWPQMITTPTTLPAGPTQSQMHIKIAQMMVYTVVCAIGMFFFLHFLIYKLINAYFIFQIFNGTGAKRG